jgi:hypothetical protein
MSADQQAQYEVRRATEELDRAGVEKYDNRERNDSTDDSEGAEWSIQKRIRMLAASGRGSEEAKIGLPPDGSAQSRQNNLEMVCNAALELAVDIRKEALMLRYPREIQMAYEKADAIDNAVSELESEEE